MTEQDIESFSTSDMKREIHSLLVNPFDRSSMRGHQGGECGHALGSSRSTGGGPTRAISVDLPLRSDLNEGLFHVGPETLTEGVHDHERRRNKYVE